MPDARLEEIRVKLAGRTRYEGRELTDEEYLYALVDEARGVLEACAYPAVTMDDERLEWVQANVDRDDIAAARSLLSKLGGSPE